MDFDEYEYLEKTVENPEPQKAKETANGGDETLKSGEKGRSRSSKHKSDEKGHDEERHSKRSKSGDDSREHDHDRHRERGSSRHRSRSREVEKDRHRSSREHRGREDREREERNGRERDRDRDKERDPDRARDRRERDREGDKDDKDREKEKERSRRSRSHSERHRSDRDERERSRDVEHKERDKEKDLREREKESRRHKDKKEEVTEPEADPERDQRTVFAYQICLKADERDVYEFFSRAGKVRDVRLIMDRNSRRSKGVGYIEFYDAMSVPMAIALSGQPLLGQPVMVKPSEAEKNLVQSTSVVSGPGGMIGPYSGGARRLYVGNLHTNIKEDDLRQVFGAFGPVELVQLPVDETNNCKGFGFVQFSRLEDARNALSLNGQLEIAGRLIKVSAVTDQAGMQDLGANAGDFDDDEGGGLIIEVELGLKMFQSRVFRIESKSFSVRTDNLSRGGAILITEKSRGKSFLISLEVDCVVWLRIQLGDALKGSEAQFFRQFKGDSFLFWVERHCNSKGWFLRLSKCTRGVVRSLVIPQGKNAIGWRTMEESLGSLLNFNGKKSPSDVGCDSGRSRSSSFSYRDAVKGSNEVQKDGSRSMGGANRNWDLTLVIERKQVHNSWKEISGALSVSLGRAVHMFPFQPSKAFMDCESGEEMQRLLWGSTSLNGGLIEVAFSSWEESWGLNDAKVVSYGGWVAVSGLPLNWWNPKFLSQVGEACGGILQIDRVTDRFLYLHEAKIKVKENNSGFLPQFVKVSEGDDAVFVTISPISPAIKPPSNGKAMITFTDGRELKSTAIEGVSAFQQDEGQSRSFPVGRADKDGTWRRKVVCTNLGTAQKGGFSALDGVQREKEGKVMENGTRATHFGNRFSPFINCCLGEDVFLKGSAAPEEFSSLYRVEDFLDDLGVEKVVPISAVFSDSELDFNSTGPKLDKTVPNKHGGSILGAGPVGPVPSLFLPSSKPSRHSDFGPGLFRPSAPPKNPPSASRFFSKYGNGAHTLRRNDPKFFGSFKAKEAAASTDFSDGEEDSCDTDEIDSDEFDSELELLSDFGDGLDSSRDSVREDLLRGDGSVLDFDDADSLQQDAGEGLDITLCEDGMLEKLFGDLTPTPEMEVIPDFTGKEEGELKIQVDDPGLSNSSSSVSLVGKKDKIGNNSVKTQTYCRRKELPPVPIKNDVKAKHSGLLTKLGISVVPLKKTLIFGKNGGLASACKVQGGKLDRNFVTKSGVGVPKRPIR